MHYIKLNPKRFTIIYLDLCNAWELTYEEYLILNTMSYFSKKNAYSYGINFLVEYLELSRNTIVSHVHKLIQNGFIEKNNKKGYDIHFSVLEELQQEHNNSKYVKVYHVHRKQLGLSILEYTLLYYFYSQSRRDGICRSHFSYTHNVIGISERMYYVAKKKFKLHNLIEHWDGYKVKLSKPTCDWFSNI